MRTLLLASAVALMCGPALAVEYPCDWSAGYAGNPDSQLWVNPAEWVEVWQNCDPGYEGQYYTDPLSGWRHVSLIDHGPGGHSPWIDYEFYYPYSWSFGQDMQTGRAFFDGAPGEWCILEFGGGDWYDLVKDQTFDPTPEQIKFTIVPEPAVLSSLAGLALALGGLFGLRRR